MSAAGCRCTDETMTEILARFPNGAREQLIPLLQAVQETFGYLPEQSLGQVGKHLGIAVAKIYGVATFYNQFRLQPVGTHTIRVCRGTACHVRGSKQVLEAFSDALKVQPGETTADGEFTLETVACIGACSIAPVVTIDDDFHGHVSPRKVEAALKPYRKTAAVEAQD
jgi:NADH-quinone oxidoreductase subunit E